LDPNEAIDGGARYVADLESRLSPSVPEDERIWFAIAAYNIGRGHLEDARKLTQQRGGDPNLWTDVRRHLPLLSRESVARTTRYGKARGGETVHFVRNIRRYFDTLRQLEPIEVQTPSSRSQYGWSSLRLP
jgi:membrane-bound lytic murein transglycosylase F